MILKVDFALKLGKCQCAFMMNYKNKKNDFQNYEKSLPV